MIVNLERDSCTGHARCNAAAPKLFPLDDDGYCAVSELLVEREDEAAAHAGVDSCPERALTVSGTLAGG